VELTLFVFGSIVSFDANQLGQAERETVRKDFFGKPQFTLQAVTRASLPCGALFKWLDAQLQYAEVLENAVPLSQTIEQLEKDASALRVVHHSAVF
jgi:hypothetical protein